MTNETDTGTIESIVRELAGRIAPDDYSGTRDDGLLDPRFAALRGKHEWFMDFTYDPPMARCKHCRTMRVDPMPYCLRTDLDSIVEAFSVATGHEFTGAGFNFCKRDGGYDVQFTTDGDVNWGWHHGETKAEAAARALKGAVDGNSMARVT